MAASKGWLFSVCILVSLSLVNSVRVNTLSGPVEGRVMSIPDTGHIATSTNEVSTFKGVPYAQPPVGNLRFEKPLPVTPWTDTLNASDFGAQCTQTPPGPPTPELPLSEDCLTLNIFVPGNLSSTADKKAVMIWIHGGGLQTGTTAIYEGYMLSALGDVIVVTINYRLNVFGFLNSDGAAPSNVGFWDQHLAIRWVRDNIATFGGDVSKITIFGESGGAWSVAYQSMSPQNDNTLFQRAIYQSGGYMAKPFGRVDSKVTALKIAEMMGCSATSSADAISCLKDKPIAEFQSTIYSQTVLEFLPVKDGEFVMEDPFKLLADFAFNGVGEVQGKVGNLGSYDSILGYNSQEGLLVANLLPTSQGLSMTSAILRYTTEILLLSDDSLSSTEKSFLTNMVISQYYDKELPPSIASRSADDQRIRLALDMAGDLHLAWPTIESALLHSAVKTNKKTYLYEFDHRRSFDPFVWTEGPDWLRTGADHFDEVPFVFGLTLVDGILLDQNYTEAEKTLTFNLVKYWTNFAKTGDPNTQSGVGRGNVTWPEIEEGERKYLRFTTDTDVIESRPLGGRADFWRSAVTSSVETPIPVDPAPIVTIECTTPSGTARVVSLPASIIWIATVFTAGFL